LVLVYLALSLAATCHPECRWQCDDPVCPAQCHPICDRPKCQVQCEEPPCASCTVHCERPECSVRCPKDMCEKESCPQCETVCAPAACHTQCISPAPVCSPMCEEVNCNWKCAKPTLCPKPKCELACEKPACEDQEGDGTEPPLGGSAGPCCPCAAEFLQLAYNNAVNGALIEKDMIPSLVEVQHTMKFAEQESGKEACCPCGPPPS